MVVVEFDDEPLSRSGGGTAYRPRMPDEDSDKDRDEHDDHDAERCRAATMFTVVVHYNRAISHTGSCSFRHCSANFYPRLASTHACSRKPATCGMASAWRFVFIQIAFALRKKRGGAANYYERDVYAMTRRTHASYALASVLFAVLFVLGYFSAAVPTIPLLAAYALVFIFYFSSFARGFSDEE